MAGIGGPEDVDHLLININREHLREVKSYSIDRGTVILEPGIIAMVVKGGSSFDGLQTTGTPMNNDYTEFNNIVDAEMNKMAPEDKPFMEGKMNAQNTLNFEEKLEEFKKRYSKLTNDADVKFVKSHTDSDLALNLMSKIA